MSPKVAPGWRENGDFFGDRVAGNAGRVVELAEDDEGVAFGVVDDLLFDVVVDGRLDGRHESGTHVDRGCAECKGGDKSGTGSDSAAGDDRDRQCACCGGDQHEPGDVVLTGVPSAFESVDADGVDTELFGLEGMPHRDSLVDHLYPGGLERW